MTDTDPFRDLILDRKGGRTYGKLSDDCGGQPTSGRLQQMATTRLKAFPDPETLKGLAIGLGVSVTRIILTAAESLDLPVQPVDDGDMTLYGAGHLPESSRTLLQDMAREFLKAHRT
ncbi:hypothetical protein [Arthrobacter cryoconiti]|uniref:Transcriptional regulator n=1 Tax=Arthrobacter cryoconiti TaxID=748907 RepID=A0ABV8QZ44_9MICC|nr:hypothetical protein [Arthrobacter cryoconiti]MCC9068851.1 hypothetical protein [Arthrobacter cryoconiti]